MKKYLNGELVNMTSEDIAEASKITESINADLEKQKSDRKTNEALKASAKVKLVAGEALTEDEANTIVL
tara:strand:- start:228 stop:434 length:207 start_codon:yes stop_codon:yes gene_type:complete